MNKNLSILSNFSFIAETYLKIVEGEELPIRSLYMLSSRFSGKTYQVELLFTLLFLQTKKKVVMNYVRARGEDAYKAKDTLENLIREYSNNQVKIKTSLQTKNIKGKNNKINFFVLNEIKEKVSKTGGKVGVPIEYDADYIITFFEESSQLDEDLVTNLRQSIRGNANTELLFIYASNPWLKTHWFMKFFASFLPENKKMEEEIIDRGYNAYFDKTTKSLFYRPRYTLNPHVKKEQVDEVERLKEINYSKWRIVSLGMSGPSDGTLYQRSLTMLNENINENMNGTLVGGIDWGDGKSKDGSPTTAYIGIVSMDEGIHILDEYEYWNNRGESLSTEEQLLRVCEFYIRWYEKYKRPITCFIDNAALGDFFVIVQTLLEKLGYNASQIEFLPAIKPKNTWERVETLNVLISLGIFRFKRETCPKLYDALENCYEVIKTNPTEEMKRQRSHEYTHWIHAIEYLIGSNFKEFQARFPILIATKSLEGRA